jgi:hypothetical protein
MIFEQKLFSFFTLENPDSDELRLSFSQRLRVVGAMLIAMRAELDIIKAEREAGMAPPEE